MNININKQIVVIIVISLIIGGIVGGAIGTIAGSEMGGHRRDGVYERDGMNKDRMIGDENGYDNQKDGEGTDDKGEAPNSDENTASSTNSTSTGSMIKNELKSILK